MKTDVATLPHLPGVYRMLNAAGEVLYVGKARDLRKRVASYFHKTHADPRIQSMVPQIADVEITVTRSESEALLLENNLIKAHHPRYNIFFRDDKSYPYLLLSGHAFPRLGFHRGPLDKSNKYFGPFPNAGAVRESIQLMQKVFRIRTCEDSVYNYRSRPCLLYQIARCTAPCVKLIDQARYAEDVAEAIAFLQGKEDQVVSRLAKRMESAAANTRYEEAALYRDQIRSLTKVRETQSVSGRQAIDADVVACVADEGLTSVNLVMFRNGRHLGDRSFFPENAKHANAPAVLEAFIAQHYLKHEPPPLIVVNHDIAKAALESSLSEKSGRTIRINSRQARTRKQWVAMAEQNARVAIAQKFNAHATQESRLEALQNALDLPSSAQRIECFDISHTMGEASVASCVVYDKLNMQPSEYRRYNISGITPGDDYAAMRDVLTRRYKKLAGGEGKLPDLILIDGGKGQVAVAKGVLADLGLNDVCLIGIVKGEDRKPAFDQLVSAEGIVFKLPAEHQGLHLLQKIRDEAHRFAITGHRARRGKARTHSTLEDIAGIGAKRRQTLLTQFGGLRGVVSASVEELSSVEGISRDLARKIYHQLH
ncbi:MAG: excinuclease ABC subunit UvrC [Burkholderiales bacterium]